MVPVESLEVSDAEDEINEYREESFCSCRTRQADKAQVLAAVLSLCACLVTVIMSYRTSLFRLETVERATGFKSCYNYGWLFRSACSNDKNKQFLLQVDPDLGVSGLGFGIAHLVQAIALLILCVSLCCYDPKRPIRCFRGAVCVAVWTMFAMLVAVDILFPLYLQSRQPRQLFHRFTFLWAYRLAIANATINLAAAFLAVFACVRSRRSSQFENIPPSLSAEDLEEFYDVVGRRFSASMSPPTHRRRSSTFSAILGLNLTPNLTPNGLSNKYKKETNVFFADPPEISSSGAESEPLSVELEELVLSGEESTTNSTNTSPHTSGTNRSERGPIDSWISEDVSEYVQLVLEQGHEETASLVLQENIDGHRLWRMDDADLLEAGFENPIHRHRIMKNLNEISDIFQHGIVDANDKITVEAFKQVALRKRSASSTATY